VRGNNLANNPANNPGNNSGNNLGNNAGNSQLWYVDSGYSRHMAGEKFNFLSLTAAEGGIVAFGNGKSGTIVGIGKIGEPHSNSIDSVYLVDSLKHNLLGVSQLCDKNNLVVFSQKRCLVVNMNIGDVVLRGKRHKNVYKMCISSLPENNLTCLNALNDNVMLWHKSCLGSTLAKFKPSHLILSSILVLI